MSCKVRVVFEEEYDDGSVYYAEGSREYDTKEDALAAFDNTYKSLGELEIEEGFYGT